MTLFFFLPYHSLLHFFLTSSPSSHPPLPPQHPTVSSCQGYKKEKGAQSVFSSPSSASSTSFQPLSHKPLALRILPEHFTNSYNTEQLLSSTLG